MKLIDADNITLYYGGLVYIGAYDFEGIAKYFGKQIKAQDEVKAIPCDFIYRMINEPNNAGMKRRRTQVTAMRPNANRGVGLIGFDIEFFS